MSGLRVFVDFLSQPARAVVLFIKANNIKHEINVVSLAKGENRTEEYKRDIHPFGKVPAIIDDGFKLIESVAILRYLARKYNVPDHWYPKSLEGQAKVDEFIEWQHTGFRVPLASYFFTKVVKPLLMGIVADEKELEALKTKMELALDDFENVWLKNGPFIVGDKISVADILALCEIDELGVVSYDVVKGRPKLADWMKRVKSELSPHYQEVTAPLKQFAESISKK